jgi:hypothetical protein
MCNLDTPCSSYAGGVLTRPSVRICFALLAIVLFASACDDGARPTPAEWRPVWDGVVADLPTATELGDPPDGSLCATALGLLRTTQSDLFPTPDSAIDDVVKDWVSLAEDLLFECPPSSSAIPDLAFAYGQLERLEAEVDVVLQIDTPSG